MNRKPGPNPTPAEALWLDACDQFYAVLNRHGERAAKMLAYAALVAMMPDDAQKGATDVRRKQPDPPPTIDNKPVVRPPKEPPNTGDRKASIKRAAAIIARAEHTRVEDEEATLIAILEAGV